MTAPEIEIPRLPPLFLVRLVEGLRALCARVARRLTPDEVALMDAVTRHWVGRAIGVAAQLGIADLLAAGPRGVDELARAAAADEGALYRLLRALAGHGIFTEVGPRRFANSKTSALLCAGARGGLRDFALHHQSDANWRVYGEMLHAVRTGESAARKVFGMDPFEHLEKDPALNEIFNRSMTATSELSSLYMARCYPFARLRSLVDVGGGQGFFLACALRASPACAGTLLDLPHVVAGAERNAARLGVAGRLRVVAGDFFAAVPAGAEAYLLKNVLHDWGDDDCLRILGNVRAAAPPGARLICVEAPVAAGDAPSFGKDLDLEMLVCTRGGRERTLAEYAALFARAGFRPTRAYRTPTPFRFIEGVRD